MKKQVFTAMMLIASMAVSFQSYAQDAQRKGNWDVKTIKACRVKVSSVENGCAVSFNYSKIEYNVKSPRDAASGQSSGKRQHKPYTFIVSSMDNSITETNSTKEVAAGLSRGKVSYSDLSVMISLDGKPKKLTVEDGEFDLPTDLPDGDHNLMLSWSWGSTNTGSNASGAGGGGRVTASFSVTISEGVCMAIKEQGVKKR